MRRLPVLSPSPLAASRERSDWLTHRVLAAGLVLPSVFLLGGCGLLEQCGGGTGRLALDVTAVDAVTGGLPTFPLTLTVRDAGPARTYELTKASAQGAANIVGENRPGTYTLEIAAPGYQLWRRESVRVDENRCGEPETERVTARLERLPVASRALVRTH